MQKDRGITIYFDGNCGICIKYVLRIKNSFMINPLILENAHAHPERRQEMLEHNSWIIIDTERKSHYRYEGFLVLIKASQRFKKLYPFFALSISNIIGDAVYKHISRNRGISE